MPPSAAATLLFLGLCTSTLFPASAPRRLTMTTFAFDFIAALTDWTSSMATDETRRSLRTKSVESLGSSSSAISSALAMGNAGVEPPLRVDSTSPLRVVPSDFIHFGCVVRNFPSALPWRNKRCMAVASGMGLPSTMEPERSTMNRVCGRAFRSFSAWAAHCPSTTLSSNCATWSSFTALRKSFWTKWSTIFAPWSVVALTPPRPRAVATFSSFSGA
mmetsp:Transcript_3556/g.6896  ORF Transcript_3556/g.6896 Transcript_3556/m.6896 type:complete len:217 (-) Transcript_3556:205-855(-)